jgi:gluconolactonase
LDAQGRLLACEHGARRVSSQEKDDTFRVLADTFEGKKLNSPNDLVVKSNGAIYFTDPPYGIKSEQEQLGFSGIYRIAPDGKLTLLDKSFPRPNGLAFSPDEKRLYVNDSQENIVYVFDVNADGTLANKRVLADVKQQGLNGAADGMKVNINGEIVTTAPGGVCVIAPDGKILARLRVPETTTNVAFGGNDWKTLFITAGSTVYRIRMKIAGVRPAWQK